MTNKLVAIINSLKVPKIKKIILYEMKFLVRNYSCLQNPWLGGYCPQIPFLSVLCPQPNLLKPPPRTKFLGMPLIVIKIHETNKLERISVMICHVSDCTFPWLHNELWRSFQKYMWRWAELRTDIYLPQDRKRNNDIKTDDIF